MVHHEEAQIFVHDLKLFATAQSLGKRQLFCRSATRTMRVKSQPKLGKLSFAKKDIFVFLVVPGFSTKSGNVSSSTSPPQDSSRREVERASGNSRRSSSSPESERSDEMAPGNRCDPSETQNKNKKRDDRKTSHDPLADQEFTDNLENTELPARTHSSQDSDSECLTKVVSTSSNHGIFTHLRKDQKCEIGKRTEMTRVPCRKRNGEAALPAENSVT